MEEWLANLELSEYTQLFHREGYKSADDIVNLKDLDLAQLKSMGITKKGESVCRTVSVRFRISYDTLFLAHLQRLKVALDSLALPSQSKLTLYFKQERVKVGVFYTIIFWAHEKLHN